MKTEPRIDPLFKLTNKKAIVVDELLDGRTKGLIDEPEEEQGYIKAILFTNPMSDTSPTSHHSTTAL